ncbi:MAG TPA: ATP-binding protein [Noviherbaspirillum sp.]|nr:ATP-binding protein [Noviherbaspirillum sp.]
MSKPPARFDREIPLAELLRALPRAKLESALAGIVGDRWRIADSDGATMLGPGAGTEGTDTWPLRVDFEEIGKLEAAGVPRERGDAAAAWLGLLLASAYRYCMAADLHLEAVHADFEALQQKHAALQESERRYRELAGQLEQRVKAQVDVIERTQRQLYQAEKLASVGSLAAGMAHEINNPIGFVRSNLSTAAGYVQKMRDVLENFRHGDAAAAQDLWRKLDVDFVLEDFPGLLEESVGGADRIAQIVANLKAYASIDVTEAAPVDLNELVRVVAGVIGDQLPADIRLDIDTQPLPLFACDQGRFNQALFALVQNAQQALAGGGRIRIATCVAGGEIRIAVSDTGRGIAPDVMNRMFDPFFTTREVGKGMGLGLTISRDVVMAHGGHIDVDTAPGSGSTFTIRLPLAACATQGTDSLEKPR